MRLDAVAVLAVAVAALSAPAFAAEPKPIPYLAALGGEPSTFQADSAATAAPAETLLPSRRSCVVREAALAGAAIGLGFLLDDTFEPGSGEGTAMDDIGQFIGSPFTLGGFSGAMALEGAVSRHASTVGTAKRLLVSITATTVTIAGLKAISNRERPDGSDRNSFPSGHSGASFAAATVLDREYGGAAGWTAYGVASFVAASRVVGNRHFFSDVVAGAAVGRFFGRIFTMHRH